MMECESMEFLCRIFGVPPETKFGIGGINKEMTDRKGNVIKTTPLLIPNNPYRFTEHGLVDGMHKVCPDLLGNLCTDRFFVERRQEVLERCGLADAYSGGKPLPVLERAKEIARFLGVRLDSPLRLVKDGEFADDRTYFLTEKGLFVKARAEKGFPKDVRFPCNFLYGEVLYGKCRLVDKMVLKRGKGNESAVLENGNDGAERV